MIFQLKNTQFQSSELFPDIYFDIEGTDLMSTFDNKSLNNVTLKSTTTRQCSNYNNVSSSSYRTIPSINNYTASDKFINTTYNVYAPLIDN